MRLVLDRLYTPFLLDLNKELDILSVWLLETMKGGCQLLQRILLSIQRLCIGLRPSRAPGIAVGRTSWDDPGISGLLRIEG